MPFEFPPTPAVDDDYTIGGIVYTWTGTNWDIKGGNDPQDFILRAGDTMTGPLGFGAATHSIFGDLHLKHNVPAGSRHYFYVNGLEKLRIEGDATPGNVIAQGHIYSQAGGRFIWNNTDNNAWQNFLSCNGGIHLQYHQGGNNDGRLRIFTSNGGYSDAWVMETTIVSGAPGINVNGQMYAGGTVSGNQLVNRGANHIFAADIDGYGIRFYAGAHIYKVVGSGMVLRKHTGNTQWQIEQNDGSGRVAIATTSLVRGDMLVEDQIEERVAPLLARIAALETEIATLKAQPRTSPTPPPAPVLGRGGRR